jgi:hypothetical protein
MSISSKKTVLNRQELENEIADAKNTIVVWDANGRWIFECYLAGHSVKMC